MFSIHSNEENLMSENLDLCQNDEIYNRNIHNVFSSHTTKMDLMDTFVPKLFHL